MGHFPWLIAPFLCFFLVLPATPRIFRLQSVTHGRNYYIQIHTK